MSAGHAHVTFYDLRKIGGAASSFDEADRTLKTYDGYNYIRFSRLQNR